MAARVAAAEHLGQAVGDGVVAALALQVPSDAPLVINPSPVRRAGLVPQTVVAPDAVSDIVLEVADGHEASTITFSVGRIDDPAFDIDAVADEIDRLAGTVGRQWTSQRYPRRRWAGRLLESLIGRQQ